MDEKIIQIMPAPKNLFVVHEDEEREFTTRVVCLALTDHGRVFMMDTDDFGEIEEISKTHKGLQWEKQMRKEELK